MQFAKKFHKAAQVFFEERHLSFFVAGIPFLTSHVKMAAAKALRFGSHLKELRIHLCQKSPASQGVR